MSKLEWYLHIDKSEKNWIYTVREKSINGIGREIATLNPNCNPFTNNGESVDTRAALIVVAPDMLSELKESTGDLIDCIDSLEGKIEQEILDGLWFQIEKNRAIIKRAEGVESC